MTCISCWQSLRRICRNARNSPRRSACSIACCVRACLPLRGGSTSAVLSRLNSSSATASSSLYRCRNQSATPSSVGPHYPVKREGGLEQTRVYGYAVVYANTDRADGRVEAILPELGVFGKRPKSTGQYHHS